MDDIPMWTCPICEDLNAIGLDKCRCGELRPAAFSIKFIEPQSPLGLELLELSTPSAAKSRKRPSKREKEASKRTTTKQLYQRVNWAEFSQELHFLVSGEPVAKQRPRLGRGGTYTPKKTKDYEKLVKDASQGVMQDKQPLTGLLQLTIVIMRKDGKRADIDNVLKSLMDGMNGIIYCDDSQVAELATVRLVRYASHEGVSILVKEFAQFPVQKKIRKPRLEKRIAA